MNCISSPELEDHKLLAYLDGEADQQTTTHLKYCQYCRSRAKTLGRFQDSLASQLYRITCPSSLELGEYHLRMLPSSQMLVVAQHLRECPHCAREINELQNYLGELALPEASGVSGSITVLIARLVGEGSSMLVAPSALRGEGKGPITYEADGLVIILDIQAAAGGHASIMGQVAAEDQDQWTDAMVELRQAKVPPQTASLDDLGSFHFEEVPIDSTELTITSSHGVIVRIPRFDLAV